MSVCMCVCNKAEWDFAAHPHGSTGVREKKERRETKDYSIFSKPLANTFISVGINHAGPLLPNDVGRDFTFAPISFLSLLCFFASPLFLFPPLCLSFPCSSMQVCMTWGEVLSWHAYKKTLKNNGEFFWHIALVLKRCFFYSIHFPTLSFEPLRSK